MTGWRDHLGEGLELGAELSAGLDAGQLPPDDRARLEEARDLLADAIEALAQAEAPADRRRALGTVAALREVIQQTSHLDAILAAHVLRATARTLAAGAIRIALEAGASALMEDAA